MDEGVSRNVNLFISADICADSAKSCITAKSEERQEHKENRTLGNHCFGDGVIWMSNPCCSEAKRLGFSLLINTDSIGDVTKCKVMILFVSNVGDQKIPRHLRYFSFKSVFNEVSYG